jgi:hypothetical protein
VTDKCLKSLQVTDKCLKKPEEEKALKAQAETEKLKAKGPYRQTQIGSEAVNVKRMTPIDKHKWGQKS